MKRPGSDARGAGIRASVSAQGTALTCIRVWSAGAGDVHPFVSEKMICKYKNWQEGIMNENDNK